MSATSFTERAVFLCRIIGSLFQLRNIGEDQFSARHWAETADLLAAQSTVSVEALSGFSNMGRNTIEALEDIYLTGYVEWLDDLVADTGREIDEDEKEDVDEYENILAALGTIQFKMKGKQVEGAEGTCSICFDAYTSEDEVVGFDCTHTFHLLCLKTWLKFRAEKHQRPTCPLCRKLIEI